MKTFTQLGILSVCLLSSANLFAETQFESSTKADDRSFYVGGGVGYALSDDCSNYETNAAVTCDYGDSFPEVWKIYGGMKFSPSLAAEIGYNNYGEASITASDGTSSAELTGEASALTAAATYTMPVADNFEVFGKAGIGLWNAEASYKETSGSSTTLQVNAEEDGVGLLVGAGATFKVTENIGIRGEYEYLTDLDADMATVGATFSSF
jgi:opacity protein-like surface antigen